MEKMEPPEYVFDLHGFKPNSKLIASALGTPDDIGKIIRVHLGIEQQLNALLLHVTGVDVDRQSFHSKLVALRALLVGEKVCDVIERINRLRNNLAHKPDATFNKSIAEEAVRIASEEFPFLPSMKIRRSQVVEWEIKFSELKLPEQIAVIGAMLASYLGNMPKHRDFHSPRFTHPPKFDAENQD